MINLLDTIDRLFKFIKIYNYKFVPKVKTNSQ